MPKKQKEPVTARLDAEDYAWIEQQAVVFGDRSTVINRAVKVIRALIAKGILKWDMATLQELLQELQTSQRSSETSLQMKADREKGVRPVRIPNNHLSVAVRTDGRRWPRRHSQSPFAVN
jgi:hypothetical protein